MPYFGQIASLNCEPDASNKVYIANSIALAKNQMTHLVQLSKSICVRDLVFRLHHASNIVTGHLCA